MALGDGTVSDNINPTQPSDAGAAQQQFEQAGAKMSFENPAGAAPVGNAVFASNLPEMAVFNPGPSGASSYGDSPADRLDKNKTVGQLISAGIIQSVDAPAAGDRQADAPAQALKPGESPQVTVTYADANAGANQQAPDFIVKQDGTIEATGNPQAADPDATHKRDVVIQVERAPGSVASPDANQQQSIDGLVNYLYGRYSSDNPAIAQNGLKLNDQYGLISDNVTQQVAAKPTAPDAGTTTAAARQNFAPQTQSAMSQGSRFTPGSSGQVSRGDIDSMVPERTQPRVQDETQSTADIKNAIAGEFKPDAATAANQNAPYETSRMDKIAGQQEPAVGRYGMTYPIIRSWFGMNLGGDIDFDDPDSDDTIGAIMDNLAKHGKVSKAFAAKFHGKEGKAFAHRFVHAMQQMKHGETPSAHDMHDLMPAQLQEQITSDVVGKFAQTANGDVGKTALAFHLGKSPDQLSATESGDAGNKDYQRVANTFASASHLRDGMGKGSTANYSVSQDGTLLDSQIKQAAMSQADKMGGSKSKHECAAGVQLAWAKVGYSELLSTGDGWQMHNHLDNDPKFVRVDRDTAYAAVRQGHAAIVCRQWASDGNGAGHVETLMADRSGGIVGASDYHGEHRAQNDYYNWRNDHFYLPKVDVQSA
jgi:hypothetical protein